MLGEETYVYDRSQYLAVSDELPVVGNLFEASPEEPYLCLTLTVDPRELASLIVETGRQVPPDDHDGRALYLSSLQAPVLDGFLRLVRFLDTVARSRIVRSTRSAKMRTPARTIGSGSPLSSVESSRTISPVGTLMS